MSSARPAQLVVRFIASDRPGSLRTYAVYGLAPDLLHHATVHPRLMPVSYETGSRDCHGCDVEGKANDDPPRNSEGISQVFNKSMKCSWSSMAEGFSNQRLDSSRPSC